MARRVFCVLLAVLLAVPFTALGAVEAASVQVFTRGSEADEPVEVTEGVDYLWVYLDAEKSSVWLQLLPGSRINPEQIQVQFQGKDGQWYQLYSPANGSSWISMYDEVTSYSLLDMSTDSMTDGVQMTVSTDAAPQPSEPAGPEIIQEQLPKNATGFARAGYTVSLTDGNGNVMDSISEGTAMRFTGNVYNDENGALWCQVQLEQGLPGYIPLSSMQFINESEYIEATATPVPQEQLPENATAYAKTNYAVSLVDQNGSVLASLNEGAAMRFTGERFNDNTGALWCQVKLQDGTTGYIPLSSMQFINESEYMNAIKQPMPAHETNFAWTDEGSALYDDNGDVIGSLSGSEPVEYDGSEPIYDEQGAPWVLVRQGEKQGYVKAGTLRFMSQEEYYDYSKEKLPDHETDYLRVTNGTALYTEPGGSQTYGIGQDTVVSYTGTYKNDAAGALWCQVRTENGQIGYVPMAAMRFMTNAEYEEYTKPKETETPAPTEAPTAAPTQEPAPVPTEVPTPVPTEAPVPTVTPAPTAPAVSGYANITSNRVNVRQQPNANSSVVGSQLNASDVVYIQRTALDEQNRVWYYCKIGQTDQFGWISADYVRKMTADEEENYLRQLDKHTAAPTQTPTQAPTPVPTQPGTVSNPVTGYKKALYDIPLLDWNNIGAPSSRIIKKGTVLWTEEQVYDANGVKLDHVVVLDSSYTGFVNSEYVTQMTTQEINDYYYNKNNPRPTSTTYYIPSDYGNNFSGYAQVTTSGGTVNFRSLPSMSGSNVLARLNNRSLVRVMGQMSTGDGYTWYQCESNGQAGYVRGDFLNLLSVSDYTTILATGAYTSNNATVKVTATAKNIQQTTWTTPKPQPTQGTSVIIGINPGSAVTGPTNRVIPTLTPTATPTVVPTPTLTTTLAPTATAAGGAQGIGVQLTPTPSASPLPTETAVAFPTEKNKGFSGTGLIVALAVLLVVVAGGFYGYSVYNKSRRRQAEERARRMAAERQQQRPAVRRPEPPVTPQSAQKPQQRPYQPEGAQHPANQTSAMYRQQMENARQQPQQRNPYARPAAPAGYERPMQNVNSAMPRATVDGRTVGDARSASESETYRARTMPVAPPPTAPSDGTETPRRRRVTHIEQDGE